MGRIVIGCKYLHFKGNMYELLNIATHTETKEQFAVYKSLKDGRVWVRPLEMFASEVDHEKYPNVAQKYRFELMEMHE